MMVLSLIGAVRLESVSITVWGLMRPFALPLVGPGESLLPVCNLGEPLRPVLDDVHEGHHLCQAGTDITSNGLGGLDNLVDVLGHDLEVDNATTALGSSGLSSWRKLGHGSSDTVVEAGTKSKNQIGLLHGHVGVRRAVHSKHVQRLGVELVKATETLKGGGDGDVGLVRKLLQQLRSVGCLEDALSSVNDGLLSDVDQIGGSPDGSLELPLGHLPCGQGCGACGRRQSAGHGNGAVESSTSDILGQIDKDRARTTAGSNLERLVDPLRQLSDVLDHDVPLCACSCDTNGVGLLEGIGTNHVGDDLSGEDDHGGSVHEGILHGCDDVGGSGAGGDEHDTRLAAGAGVALSHVACTLLVSGENEVEFLAVVDGIEHGENSTTRVAN